ncbi:MAG: ABC transporter substrate-binding protein [Alphaproteobacteria bacterium]|nr:ABC transporter substrate-binding protein [Alphaproteobacteria bacterium]
MGRDLHGRGWSLAIMLAVIVMVVAKPAEVAAKDGGVQAVVQRLNTTLLDVMQSADALGYRGRYHKLDPVLRETFDFAFMAKIAVGRAWNDLDRTERAALVERFARMSVATFAARFDGYGGERFEIFGEKPGPRDTVVVDDRIVRPKDPDVGLNFVLKAEGEAADGGGWRIIDVMLDGKFSELARQRAEFSSVLKSGGYDALIAALDLRITELGADS